MACPPAGGCVKQIVAGAETITGCLGGTDPALRARLDSLVAKLNRRGLPTEQDRDAAENQLRAVLITRLNLARDRRRIRAIADESIDM
ncbi:MAG TPA: hypothetical protein VGI23_11285 [Steroidobacteraceae bacterium]